MSFELRLYHSIEIDYFRRLSSKTRDEKEIEKTAASNASFEMDSTSKPPPPWRYNSQQQSISRHRIPRTESHDSILSSISRNVAPVHNELARYV